MGRVQDASLRITTPTFTEQLERMETLLEGVMIGLDFHDRRADNLFLANLRNHAIDKIELRMRPTHRCLIDPGQSSTQPQIEGSPKRRRQLDGSGPSTNAVHDPNSGDRIANQISLAILRELGIPTEFLPFLKKQKVYHFQSPIYSSG